MRVLISSLLIVLFGCGTTDPAPEPSDGKTVPAPSLTVSESLFGSTEEGNVTKYTLTNSGGASVSVINYGGVITNIAVPDKNGELADVTLGFSELSGYEEQNPYFGALIGRYGNRIAGGKFTLDGKTYTLPTNNGPNSLHGGTPGFDKKLWRAEVLKENERVGVRLTGTSPDGDQGYPGNLSVTVDYWWNDANELTLDYRATTDAPTPVNLTNHAYFNLRGANSGADILGHVLTINAAAFTPVDKTLIPTGELRPVAGTPFDFTTPKPIGRDIEADNEQIRFGGGYDHNFVLQRNDGDGMLVAATVYEPTSGRTMEVRTEEPGVQFYTGNFLDGSTVGKEGTPYKLRSGFCLETQHFPDSPNQEAFPATVLRPDEVYRTKTVYRFGTRE